MKIPKEYSRFALAAVILTVAICIVWQLFTTLYSDDFVYRHVPVDDGINAPFWSMNGPELVSFSQVPEAVAVHFTDVNSRFANLVYIALQPLPVWVVKAMNGLMMSVMFVLLLRYARRRVGDLTVTVAVLLFWMGFHWADQLQASDFQLNYVWASVLMLAVVGIFDPDRCPGPWGWALLVVFGMWHESFTIAAITYLGVRWLYKRNRWLFVALVVLVAEVGLALLTGTGRRMADTGAAAPGQSLSFGLMIMIQHSWPAYVAVVMWIIRRRRVDADTRRDIDRMGWAVTGVFVVLTAMTIVLNSPMRGHWPAEVFMVAFIIRIVSTYKPRRFACWLGLSLLAVYALWGSSLVYWQWRVKAYSDDILAGLSRSNCVAVTDRAVYARDIPFWLMNIVREPVGPRRYWQQFTLACHAAGPDAQTFVTIPTAAKNLPFDEWPKVPGNNDLRGFGDQYVRRCDGTDLCEYRLILHLEQNPANFSPVDFVKDRVFYHVGSNGCLSSKAFAQLQFVYQGDTLENVFFDMPTALVRHHLVGIDYVR